MQPQTNEPSRGNSPPFRTGKRSETFPSIVGSKLRYVIFYVRNCSSTQDLAMKLFEQGYGEGLVVVAEEMSSGRGRLGRSWLATSGGLWFTLVLTPPKPANLQILSLGVGSSVAKTLRELYEIKAVVKWPNDVLVNGRKIAGILIEGRKTLETALFVGVGINVNNEIPGELRERAVSIKEVLKRQVSRTSLLAKILQEIEGTYIKLLNEETDKILEEWRGLTETLGRKVKVVTGKEVVEGVAVDVASDGSLIIEDLAGVKRFIYVGDVIHLT
jgi:BirA family biotin operon repressor/biotin-[acetyl-CoA-carboxylase] ligase